MNHTLRELNAEEISAVSGGYDLVVIAPSHLPPIFRFDPEPAPWRIDPDPSPWHVGP